MPQVVIAAKVNINYSDATIQETTTITETTQIKNNDNQKQQVVKEETKSQTNTQKSSQTKQKVTQPQYTAEQLAKLEEYNKILAQIAAIEKEQQSYQNNGNWKIVQNHWEFYNQAGERFENRWLDYNGKTYYFDAFGFMVVGWKKIGSKWYYFNKDGSLHKGWLQLGADEWYYLDSETGIMATSDRYIDGTFYHFNNEGVWIKDILEYETSNLANYVKNMIKFVDNKSSLKTKHVSTEYKKSIYAIIELLPKDVLGKLVQECEHIYICVDNSKNYIRTVSYKDSDGDRTTEYLPFTASRKQIIIDGSNIYNLYYGIGCFLATTMKYQGKNIAETASWKSIHSNLNGEIDELMSLSGSYDLIIYIADANTSLSCAIGWYLLAPLELRDANTAIHRYISMFLGRQTSSPADELEKYQIKY